MKEGQFQESLDKEKDLESYEQGLLDEMKQIKEETEDEEVKKKDESENSMKKSSSKIEVRDVEKSS